MISPHQTSKKSTGCVAMFMQDSNELAARHLCNRCGLSSSKKPHRILSGVGPTLWATVTNTARNRGMTSTPHADCSWVDNVKKLPNEQKRVFVLAMCFSHQKHDDATRSTLMATKSTNSFCCLACLLKTPPCCWQLLCFEYGLGLVLFRTTSVFSV